MLLAVVNEPPNNQLALDCPNWVFVVGVQPATLVEFDSYYAGKVGS